MSRDFNVEIINRETITPSSPTPPYLRNVSLSFLDQISPDIYPPWMYFYPNHHHHASDHEATSNKSTLLKASLSKTLTHLYPLAGEYQHHNVSIICDDRGASFIEAKVNCRLSEILTSPNTEKLKCLIAAPLESTQAHNGNLVLIQVSFFECGGMAIATSISHKVADGFTFNTFMKTWAAFSQGSSTSRRRTIGDQFGVAASLYPPQESLNAPKPVPTFSELPTRQGECTTRRFLFDASRVAALKLKAASAYVPNPTRVEVVSALIWKCVVEASRSSSGSIRPSMWWQAMDMRRLSGETLTRNLLGNFVWYPAATTIEKELDYFRSLVAAIRKCKEDYKVKYPNGVTAEDAYETIKECGTKLLKEGMDCYSCSSFGWGKPIWVSTSCFNHKDSVFLTNARDGNGIEASLTLSEVDMSKVENNPELLAYASLNPSVAFGGAQSLSLL